MKRATPGSSRHDPLRKRLSGVFGKSRDSFANNRSASRNSSMYRRRVDQGPLKDPRNLSSKGVQREMIDEILSFLQTNNFPHQISHKILQAPASKDFVKVFEFLYGFIDNTEKIGKKIEEEFPRLMKQLRYPFPVAKSAMFTIGSLHTWPSLLGALHWLVQLVEMTQHIDPEKILFAQNDEDPLSGCEKIIHSYFEKTYKDFMNNIFDTEEDDMKLRDAIFKQTGALDIDLESLKLENERLDCKLKELEAEPNRLKEMQHNIEFWTTQCEKMEIRQEEMKEDKRAREAKLKKLNEELQKYDYRRIREMQSRGSLEHEEERFMNRLKAIEAENENLLAKCWEKEMAFSRASSKLDKKLAEYNDQVRNISFDPCAMDYLQGQNIAMKFDHQQTDFMNPSKFKSVIKDVLIGAQDRALSDVRKLESDVITEQEKLEKLTDAAKEAECELDTLKAKLEQMTVRIDDTIEKNEKEQKELDDELAALRTENKNLAMGNNALLETKKAELTSLKERLQVERDEHEEKLENVAEFLKKVTLKWKEHKDKIGGTLANLMEVQVEQAEKIKNLEPIE